MFLALWPERLYTLGFGDAETAGQASEEFHLFWRMTLVRIGNQVHSPCRPYYQIIKIQTAEICCTRP